MELTGGEISDYFKRIKREVEKIYEVACQAKLGAFDPSDTPEIFLANDLAERVEGLLRQYGIFKIADRIRELNEKNSREVVALKIAEEIVYGRYGNFSEEKRAEIAIRAALAILTEGITAAPLQGIDRVKIKKNPDGSKYLAVYYAGPIRSAGGTEQALTVLVGDYVRQLLHLDKYKPTEEEVKRYIEEIRLYERNVGRFQYHNTDREIERAVKRIPIEVTGVPTTQIEVSIHRDLPRIETNKLRGGACRVINDGVIGKAKKLMKIAEDVGIGGWDWLMELSKSSVKEEESVKVKPSEKYLEDIVAGRPIFAHPSRTGGFRLRYGRSRNTGLAAIGLNPATMLILGEFLAIGTQVRTERPGKSSIIMPVTSIEGPIVKLEDESVIQVNSLIEAQKILDKIKEILFLGDILIAYGEFLENNHPLLPSGYVEEWWVQEVLKALKEKYEGDLKKFGEKTGISEFRLREFIFNYIESKPKASEAIKISEELEVPLHPRYTYYWNGISAGDIKILADWIREKNEIDVDNNGTFVKKPYDHRVKRILEDLWITHKLDKDRLYLWIDKEDLKILERCIAGFKSNLDLPENGLEAINSISRIKIRNKAPTFIGLRMGRPEKAKERKMKPPVHVLFPVGIAGGNSRNVIEAAAYKTIKVENPLKICLKCKERTFYEKCPKCGERTVQLRRCPKCGRITLDLKCKFCNVNTKLAFEQNMNISEELRRACVNLNITAPPKIVKGVRGLTNPEKIPEPLEKGVLRARHNVYVYKDGTIRFDMTNAPLTHFTPREIHTSIRKLIELGYTKDIYGKPLENEEQLIELKVQDIVIPLEAADYLIRIAKFVDELLVRYYKVKPFYQVNRREDLIGHVVIGIAPHTSAGVIGRIIGFTNAKVCFAHPYWHAAKRRNCDGDEDAIILGLDAFLNFSKKYLPERRGGLMDAPLVVTLMIDPNEVDDEVFNMETCNKYPLEFYEKTLKYCDPKKLSDIIEKVENRLGRMEQYRGLMFTHSTKTIDLGPKVSIYKKMRTMDEKVHAQMRLADKIRAVDKKDVAQRLLIHHFLPDLIGNLRAFTTQSMRCTKCGRKYDRPPLSGRCRECGGKLVLTVHKKNIEKYMRFAKTLIQKYKLGVYYRQRLDLIEKELNLLFEKDEEGKQSKIIDFWKKM